MLLHRIWPAAASDIISRFLPGDRMHHDNLLTHRTTSSDTPLDTGRWTSPVYRVQFARIERVQVPAWDDDPDYLEPPFHLSAWGISEGLYSLLVDYSARDIYDATSWLTTTQNRLVVNALEQMSQDSTMHAGNMPSLEHLFIAIETELYLPRGLRMPVSCVTNIVPHGNDTDALDKFVAVLDPGETRFYIRERKASYRPPQEQVH